MKHPLHALAMSLAALLCAGAAAPALADTGKLLLTGGVSTIDGAAGGGLTPWAVIGSNATAGEGGRHRLRSPRVKTRDYGLTGYGAALACDDRFEFSIARQDFDTGATGSALGLPGLHLKLDIVGAKLRVAGDAVARQRQLDAAGRGRRWSQAAGHRRLDATLRALGAKRNGSTSTSARPSCSWRRASSSTRTLRATKANQNGLLGFGGTLGQRAAPAGARDLGRVAGEPHARDRRRIPPQAQQPGRCRAAGLGAGPAGGRLGRPVRGLGAHQTFLA